MNEETMATKGVLRLSPQSSSVVYIRWQTQFFELSFRELTLELEFLLGRHCGALWFVLEYGCFYSVDAMLK